ncbi:hypothetical protein LguiA_012319 [Lonicera macranthoides]
MEGPLDFESEDLLLPSPLPNKKTKRKKVIGLDDLLTDYYKEKSKVIEKESKRAKVKRNYSSDEDEDTKEAELSRCVEECQKEACMGQISCEDENSIWGIQVFGDQKPAPRLVSPELGDLVLLRSFMNNEVNSLVELDLEKGEVFLERLLLDGWLLILVSTCGHVEKSLATWTFNLMLYSSDEALRTSACDFWCAILSPKNEVDTQSIKIHWLPKYSELKQALETYGFQLHISSTSSSNMEVDHGDSDFRGPPQSIRGWIKYVAACCQVRNKHSVFSISEAEELVSVIICLFLDRQLIGLSLILYNCMQSVIRFFTDKEWNKSCEKVAKSLACRVRCDINCLRLVESISGVDARSKHLRSAVAFQILLTCFDNKVTDAEEILRRLILINVKDKECDLYKTYIYLVLTEMWLLSKPMIENNPVICEMWGVYLRNCSCQISSTDLRPHASKVRSKASYLLQGSANK